MVEINEFQELGLTINEAKAYSILIQHGKLGASDISKFSQVPYSRIYDILASLEQKGFVKIVPENSKKFVPTNPDSFLGIIKKKQESLDNLKKSIDKIKEYYVHTEKNPVVLGYGKAAFHKLLKEQKETKKYDYSIKYTSEYRPEWVGSTERGIKSGKDLKSLVRYDSETKENIKKWLKTNKKIKKFDNEGIAISLKDDEETLISLIKSNMTILIKDKPFAKIMRQLFLAAYKEAEEIK